MRSARGGGGAVVMKVVSKDRGEDVHKDRSGDRVFNDRKGVDKVSWQ